MTTVDVLGIPIAPQSLEEAVATIDGWIDEGGRGYACLVNVHLVETARSSEPVRTALREATLALPDGAPVAWLASRLGGEPARRVTGSDLFAGLCSTRPRRHFFLGSTPETLERLVDAVHRDHPTAEVCGVHSPPFGTLSAAATAEMVATANAAEADVVWVGMGAPRQELWMHANRHALTAPAVIGVGAVFDFASGTKRRAPGWMQRAGLEWAHRLATEPRRLSKRYVETNTTFLLRAAGALLRP